MENGQGRAASSLDHLDHCCQLVSEIYGKPDIAKWTNGDYVRLGYILHKKTQVQISPNTLKRIFGKIKTDVRYYPQRATRDALARYVGYRDWDNFTTARSVSEPLPKTERDKPTQSDAVVVVIPETIPIPDRRKVNWSLIFLAFVLLAGVFLYSYLTLFDSVPESVSLICTNPVGGNPHSAVFVIRGLTAEMESKDRYVLDFGDSKKVPVVKGDSLFSHYYEVPWRYNAILKRNGVNLDTASVYLKTSAWTATAEMMYDTTRVYPIELDNLFTNGKKGVSALEVSRAGVDTNRTFFVKFINTQITDIDGDNFDLSVNLKTSPSRAGVRCSQVRVTVFGESSQHMFDAMKPGCVHWTDLQFSEINKQGESNQLNFLGADLHEGGSLEMKVLNQHARIFINSNQVYETNYVKPLKKIYGLSIAFSGIGAINSVMLKDLKTGKAFAGNFN
jgi:hypothetical protein